MRPAGWFLAYVSRERPFSSITAIATVSPKSSWMAVEVTGARSKGQSSRSSGSTMALSQARASFEPARQVTLTSRAPRALAKGTSPRSSSVDPLLEKSTRMSSSPTIPMSPCRASTGFKKTALVPVDTSVMEIFWAMKPLFPTPVKNTTPLQFNTSYVGGGRGARR